MLEPEPKRRGFDARKEQRDHSVGLTCRLLLFPRCLGALDLLPDPGRVLRLGAENDDDVAGGLDGLGDRRIELVATPQSSRVDPDGDAMRFEFLA